MPQSEPEHTELTSLSDVEYDTMEEVELAPTEDMGKLELFEDFEMSVELETTLLDARDLKLEVKVDVDNELEATLMNSELIPELNSSEPLDMVQLVHLNLELEELTKVLERADETAKELTEPELETGEGLELERKLDPDLEEKLKLEKRLELESELRLEERLELEDDTELEERLELDGKLKLDLTDELEIWVKLEVDDRLELIE